MVQDNKPIGILCKCILVAEPYKSFISHVKEVRDSSAHFAKYKAEIIVPPQTWEKRAKEASTVCLSVARGFWNACYPSRQMPLYLGNFFETKSYRSSSRP